MGKASRKKGGVERGGGAIRRPGTLAVVVLIALVTCVVYSNTLGVPFHFDDKSYITENAKIRELANFSDLSGTRYFTFLSFALNYSAGGLDPTGYHVVNTIIHGVNGLLVWTLLTFLLRTPAFLRAGAIGKCRLVGFVPIAAALLFVAHPIQIQAVTYITQRFASLATLFYLLSLVAYLKVRVDASAGKDGGVTASGGAALIGPTLIGRSAALYALSVASAFVAMKTKEISFTLPFVILLFEMAFITGSWRLGRVWAVQAPYLLSLLVIPLTLFTGDVGLAGGALEIEERTRAFQLRDVTELSSHDYLVTQFRVIVTYLRLLILPVAQTLDYDYPLYTSIFVPSVFASFIFLSAILAATFYFFKRSLKDGNLYGLLAATGMLWFFMTISIESSVIPILDVIFEHRLYLPSVGVAMAAVAGLFYIIERRNAATTVRDAVAVISIVVVVLAGAAYKRNEVWHDRVTLWSDVVRKAPGKVRGHDSLGLAYADLGMTDDAIREYEAAIRIDPGYVEAHNNLGMAYYKAGRTEVAATKYTEALALRPGYPHALNNLGVAYVKLGRASEGMESYRRAALADPGYAEPLYNMGNYYFKSGQMAEAIEKYRGAVEIDGRHSKAAFNLGNAYMSKGMVREAEGAYRDAVKASGGAHGGALNNLGTIYYKEGRFADAAREFAEAVRVDPSNMEATANLEAARARVEKAGGR